jgi:DNA-binding LacI/PurR family transcriptional regulator
MATRKLAAVDWLAERLEDDVRRRGLKPGDPYLSSVGAGAFLGVSSATAHRALALLARRRIVIRQPKSGTFIGPAVRAAPAGAAKTIHLLAPPDWDYSVELAGFIHGMVSEMPQVGVRFTQLPEDNRVGFLRDLESLASASGDMVGFLAVSPPPDVCEFLAERRLPAVILGSPLSETAGIPSIDHDHRAHGRLLADYLIRRGHRRLALVAEMEGRPGDSHFVDGVTEVMTDAGMAPSALTVRFAPRDLQALSFQIKDLLESKDAPTGIMTVTWPLAEVVAKTAAALDQRANANREIVMRGFTSEADRRLQLPCSRSLLTPSQFTGLAVRILRQVHRGEKPEPFHTKVPVKLHVPPGGVSPPSERKGQRHR